ncbi:hypothetical protein ABN034_01805 [Actinopolymorpha sp. B11F2]|uniref:hypothetical protein n=1 Tax=Actinopolymorpha sp. B11F2 TaxID=3160862 RepID=UPI0032E3C55F
MPVRAHERLHTLVVGGLLAIATVLVEIVYRLPPYPSDQLYYFDFAESFPASPLADNSLFLQRFVHQFLRYGLVFPMRLAQEVFGYSQGAYLLVPVAAGVALAVGVYLLGVLLVNRTVGVAGAVLTVGNSIVFPELTQPLPDLLATSLFCWAVVVAVAIRQRRRVVTVTRRRETVALLVLGVLLGWSYLTREYIVFCWPLIPLLFLRRVPLRRWLWVALPLVVIGGGEAIVNAVLFGDPLARLHASAAHGSVAPAVTDFLGHSRRWYLTRVLAVLGAAPEGQWLKGALVVTVLGAVFSRKLVVLAAWAVLFYVPLVAFGGVIDPDHPMVRILKERYWLPLMPAIMLGAVVAGWLVVHAVVRRAPPVRAYAGVAAGVAALAVAVVPVSIAQHVRMTDRDDPLNATYAVNGGTQLEQFRSWLAADGGDVDTIWADQRSVRLVRVFVNGTFGEPVWRGRIATWYTPEQVPAGTAAEAPQAGDHVMFYSLRSTICGYCRGNAEVLLDSRPARPPATWRLVFTTDDDVVQVYEIR